MKVRPCIRCLSPKYKRIRAGAGKEFKIIQCENYGWNVCSYDSFDDAILNWNGFAVWGIIDQLRERILNETNTI